MGDCLCPRKKQTINVSFDNENDNDTYNDDIIDEKILKIHICGKIDESIVSQIFPDPCNKKLKGKK